LETVVKPFVPPWRRK